MRRLRFALQISIGVTLIVWCAGWGKNDGPLFGDWPQAREMVFAGRYFAQHGAATWGLAVYGPGGKPYTHLAPGPEWIQGAIAVAGLPFTHFVSPWAWHWFLTAAVSVAAMLWLRRIIARVTALFAPADSLAQERALAAVLFVAATPSFIVYAQYAYCAGTLLGNVIAIAAATVWMANPDDTRWRYTLAVFSIALLAAFWLGSAPLVSGFIWMLAVVLRFGTPERRWVRLAQVAGTGFLIAAVSMGMKMQQSALGLGSWRAAIADVVNIVKVQTGHGVAYDAGAHLHDSLLFSAYLFGLTLPAIGFLAWHGRRVLAREWPLLAAVFAGGVAWQFVFRGHSFRVLYMLREEMVPIAMLLAVLSAGIVEEDGARTTRALYVAALVQIAGTAAVVVIPIVTVGKPLWQCLLQWL